MSQQSTIVRGDRLNVTVDSSLISPAGVPHVVLADPSRFLLARVCGCGGAHGNRYILIDSPVQLVQYESPREREGRFFAIRRRHLDEAVASTGLQLMTLVVTGQITFEATTTYNKDGTQRLVNSTVVDLGINDRRVFHNSQAEERRPAVKPGEQVVKTGTRRMSLRIEFLPDGTFTLTEDQTDQLRVGGEPINNTQRQVTTRSVPNEVIDEIAKRLLLKEDKPDLGASLAAMFGAAQGGDSIGFGMDLEAMLGSVTPSRRDRR